MTPVTKVFSAMPLLGALAGALLLPMSALAQSGPTGIDWDAANDILAQADPNKDRRIEDTLYGASDEVEDVRIGWYIDDLLTALKMAVEKQLPLVIVFSEDWCEHCWNSVDMALTCPSLNRFAGHAVFVISRPSNDAVARQLADRLDLDAVPTYSILAPNPDKVEEVARLNGFFVGDDVAGELQRIFSQNGYGVPGAGGSKAYGALYPLSKTPVDPADCGSGNG